MLDTATIVSRRQQMGGWVYAIRYVYILWADGGGCGCGGLLVEWLSSWQAVWRGRTGERGETGNGQWAIVAGVGWDIQAALCVGRHGHGHGQDRLL